MVRRPEMGRNREDMAQEVLKLMDNRKITE